MLISAKFWWGRAKKLVEQRTMGVEYLRKGATKQKRLRNTGLVEDAF